MVVIVIAEFTLRSSETFPTAIEVLIAVAR